LPTARAADDPQIGPILEAWKHRLGRLKTVRYTLTGTVEAKDELSVPSGFKRPSPKGGVRPTLPLKAVILIDLSAKKYRVERTEEFLSASHGDYISRISITAFDGKNYQTAFPRELNDLGPKEAELSISSGNLRQATVDSLFWPVFAAHGLVATVNRTLRPDQLPLEHDLEEFEVRGAETLAGRNCVVLRSIPLNAPQMLMDEFWVDPDRGAAIIRHVYYSRKNPWYRTDVEHESTAFGWLPKKWTLTWTVGGKVASISRLQVEKTEFNPPVRTEDFTLPIRPGMIVQGNQYPAPGTGLDPDYPARSHYRVDQGGALETLDQKGFTTAEGKLLPPQPSGRWRWWAGGSLLVLAITVVIGLKRRSPARSGG
jgi:hypothetical protein